MSVETLVDLYRSGLRQPSRPEPYLVKRDGAYVPVSSEEAERRIQRLAAALLDAGIRPGDRVSVLSETCLEWALVDYAILTVAAANVPLYPSLSASQIETLLADSQAALLFCSSAKQLDKIVEIWPRLESLRAVVVFDAVSPARPGRRRVIPLVDFEAAGARRLEREPGSVDERAATVTAEHLASIIYTSGTTGVPKGVMLTHRNFVSDVLHSRHALDLTPTDVTLSHLPLCHVFERMGGHFAALLCGATIAYAESFDALPGNLIEVRPTVLMSVPRLYEKIFERAQATASASGPVSRLVFEAARKIARAWSHARMRGRVMPWLALARSLADRVVYRKLRDKLGGRIRFLISGGAPLGADLMHFFHAARLPVYEGYGLTETSPVIAVNSGERWRIGTVGPPIPGAEVKIADDGEILARGPMVMKGYYRLPEATAEAIDRDGWFHTGDIGELDAQGFLRITDRKKELIVNAGGKKIAPAPIEERLKTIPGVSQAIVVGDRRPYLVALLVPDFPTLEAIARRQGIAFASREALVADSRLLDLVRREVEARSNGLATFEEVKKFALLDRELSLDAGEITPTLKVRRKKVLEHRADVVESLYRG